CFVLSLPQSVYNLFLVFPICTGSLIKHQLVTHLALGIALRGVLDALRKSVDSKVRKFCLKFPLFPLILEHDVRSIWFRCLCLVPRPWSSSWIVLLSGHNIAIIYYRYLICVEHMLSWFLLSSGNSQEFLLVSQSQIMLMQCLLISNKVRELQLLKAWRYFLDKVNSKSLNKEIVKATYENCKVLLRSDLIKSSSEERSLLKNLGSWLGKFTIGRNQALRAREIDPKALIIEVHLVILFWL
ncbi:hypothetical protein GW17_00033108, partial [Ensete ventricosum]